MGQVIQFIPKSERERVRLVREARAIYASIFPQADTSGKQQDKAPTGLAANAITYRGDGAQLS